MQVLEIFKNVLGSCATASEIRVLEQAPSILCPGCSAFFGRLGNLEKKSLPHDTRHL